MISADDVKRIARKMELAAGVVEKDYAITWLLKGIYSEESALREDMIFKGGTAIRKVYFPEIWRLSEDIDFTMLNRQEPKKIRDRLQQIFEFLGEESGLTYSFQSFHATKGSIIASVQYVGPLGAKNRIRHDISLKEKMVQKPEWTGLIAGYPDITKFDAKVYSLTEILIEKIRSIIQRGKSRDYYDVWKLLKEKEFDKTGIRTLLIKKCETNRIEYKPELIFERERLVAARTFWKKGLAHLTKNLPEFDAVILELKELLNFSKI